MLALLFKGLKMEAKDNEFKITKEVLSGWGASQIEFRIFNEHYNNKKYVKASELLKLCAELYYVEFGKWLVSKLPFNRTLLIIDHLDGHLFYNGNVYIKGDIDIKRKVAIKGNLKINGALTVSDIGEIYANHVKATKINLRDLAIIGAKTKANIINMYACVHINGNTRANTINIHDKSYIKMNVKANTINIHNKAYIERNVKANTININGNYAPIDNYVKANVMHLLDFPCIKGNIEVDFIKLKYGCIRGNVDANEIINDGGYILGDVYTHNINIINRGIINGFIFYKSPDKHK